MGQVFIGGFFLGAIVGGLIGLVIGVRQCAGWYQPLIDDVLKRERL